MKKVGIITEYHNSTNYGGVLQAYALCKYLELLGIDAEQIRYDTNKNNTKIDHNFRNIINQMFSHLFLNGKLNKFSIFRNEFIKHSYSTYNDQTISQSNSEYDIFITGSDQVWNPNWKKPAYFLEFVDPDKIKISYAASMAVDELLNEQSQFFKKILQSYSAISVREPKSKELLSNLTDKEINLVVDPTMLLDKSQWDKIIPKRMIKDEYIFCYFLGSRKDTRELIKKYSKKTGLKIINLAHVQGYIRKCDIGFADKNLYDVSPLDFVSLIKYAKVVFTDSFHAVSFSGIYEKEFFVFSRDLKNSMSSRIYGMVELYECHDHFVDSQDKLFLDYLEKIDGINYDSTKTKVEEFINFSQKFLKDRVV